MTATERGIVDETECTRDKDEKRGKRKEKISSLGKFPKDCALQLKGKRCFYRPKWVNQHIH